MASAAVDLAHLDRYTGGDAALNAEVLRLFDNQASELVERLQSILEARDTNSWKAVTHTLKGAARGIGAFGLGDAAAAAEPIDPSDRQTATAALTVLLHKTSDVQFFIKASLSQRPFSSLPLRDIGAPPFEPHFRPRHFFMERAYGLNSYTKMVWNSP